MEQPIDATEDDGAEGAIPGTVQAVLVTNDDDANDVANAAAAVALPIMISQEKDNVPLAVMEPVSLRDSIVSIESAERRPSIMSVTVLKSSPRDNVGVTIEESEDGLRIGAIDPDSPFHDTPLEEGDLILSVNHSSCELKNDTHVSRQLRRAKAFVTIVVHRPQDDAYLMSTTVMKPESTSKVGIGIQIYDGALRVSSIDPEGLFSNSILSVGDKVVSICGISCACMDSSSAIRLIRQEEKMVTIVSWTKEEAGVVVAASKEPSIFLRYRSFLPCLFSVTLVAIIALIVMLSSRGHSSSEEGDGKCRNLYGQPIPYC